jgi:lipopolysaccharide transport system ATP-binding protein
MSEAVISIENISKIYRLGEIGTGSLAHDVNRWWHRIRGKEDPYLKFGQVNDRTKSLKKTGKNHNPPNDWVYALKDVTFEVKQGEVLGIIGRNGAGKSTLLKILSRVTSQTSGQIKVKGRIASLLEVGTGFHHELTGRENIFLNGAILGMRHGEIASKFDEIVEFSGCGRYIDTPVKRYSSGMHVRLAFAVAAHLDPEILIVDEVLAVGDAEFQNKCIGKMKDVACSGRTVLFVSHNLSAISSFCSSGLVLKQGTTTGITSTQQAIAEYLTSDSTDKNNTSWIGKIKHEQLEFTEFSVCGNNRSGQIETTMSIEVNFAFNVTKPIAHLVVALYVETSTGSKLALSAQYDDPAQGLPTHLGPGLYRFKVTIPPSTLAQGHYRFIPDIGIHNVERIVGESAAVSVSIINSMGLGLKFITGAVNEGQFRPQWKWQFENNTRA